jgi:hypothetical protein
MDFFKNGHLQKGQLSPLIQKKFRQVAAGKMG